MSENNNTVGTETIAEEAVVKLGAVLYTDGSARPNPGFVGWGVHGYLYHDIVPKSPSTAELHYITDIGYVPHASKNKEWKAVSPIEYIDIVGSQEKQASNNFAEVYAAVSALEAMADYPVDKVTLVGDSEYMLCGINGRMERWCNNNWKTVDGGTLANSDAWMALYKAHKVLQDRGVVFSFKWVRGHSSIFGNTHADMLAYVGMNRSTGSEHEVHVRKAPANKYWTTSVEKHPFINHRRIYFNTVTEHNTPGHYFQAESGNGDFIIGKRIPESGYSIIRLNTPDVGIELVKTRQYELTNGDNVISMMMLDRVHGKVVNPYLATYGKHCLVGDRRNMNVNFVDNRPVTMEMNPTGLSLRALESFNHLENILDEVLQLRISGFDAVSNNTEIHSHDITSIFFDIEEKLIKGVPTVKKTLKPEYNVGFSDMKIDIVEPYEGKDVAIKVPLILGMDLLPRNNLKRLEGDNPSIHLITWRESVNSIRYATVVECSTGIGIWSNYYSNKIFLRTA